MSEDVKDVILQKSQIRVQTFSGLDSKCFVWDRSKQELAKICYKASSAVNLSRTQ